MQNETNLLKELIDIVPGATHAGSMISKKPKRQTLEEVRAKVVKKALRSKSGYKSPDGKEVTELLYKYDEYSGKYRVGLKAGNRWVKHGLFDGNSYIDVDDMEAVDKVIDMLVEWTQAGHFDHAIQEIMQAQAKRRKA